MTTARKVGEQNWIRDEAGNRLFWPIDDYGDEGERRFHWFVDGITKYHWAMATLVNELVEAGLTVTQLVHLGRLRRSTAAGAGPSVTSAVPELLDCEGCQAARRAVTL